MYVYQCRHTAWGLTMLMELNGVQREKSTCLGSHTPDGLHILVIVTVFSGQLKYAVVPARVKLQKSSALQTVNINDDVEWSGVRIH